MWKFLIFLFGYLLLMQPTQSAIETNTTNVKELKLSENSTQSTASLTEFSAKMLEFLQKLDSKLPRITDDVCVGNVEDPIFEVALQKLRLPYEDVIRLVPEADKYDTYHFITDLRIFFTELQDHRKAELIKLLSRFTKHLIDVAERYWNSLSAEERTDAQKQFHEKIQEIKTETDMLHVYDRLHNLLLTASHEKDERNFF